MAKRTVELKKGVIRWYYTIKTASGNVTKVSKKRFNKEKVQSTAKALAKALKAKYEEN